MGVLQDFERRLEGAVEGFFARLFTSGLQPIEMAKGLQAYARDTQTVSADGVVVPNVYRFWIHPKDHDRLTRLGVDLPSELAAVVVGTAEERGWLLRGPVIVRVEASDDPPVGKYQLSGRIEPVEAAPPDATPVPSPAQQAVRQQADRTQVLSGGGAASAATPRLRVVSGGPPTDVELQRRTVAGRAPSCDLTLDDSTVSREHAAFVRRETGWWVVDLSSTNGTRVNGRAAAEHPLHDGDRVTLGDAALEFVER
jgi:hypothetical protein